jgi:phosphoribosylformylglycinamidine synthase subunit PurQ / glutaminase
MAKPKIIILKEHGTNCEYESQYAFNLAGGIADIIHMEDLIKNKTILDDYQIMMFPGGFSYGDDTGSALAWANRIKNNMYDEFIAFAEKDRLILGACNGFQAIVNIGLLPGLDPNKKPQAVLTNNTNARYTVRWVDLKMQGDGPWLKGIDTIMLPIAHGEGRFYAEPEVLKQMRLHNLIAAQYMDGEICNHQMLEKNPNGSIEDIAGITDTTGRIFALMPHPERAIFFTQLPHWTFLKEHYKRSGKDLPKYGPGLKIFENGINYFK